MGKDALGEVFTEKRQGGVVQVRRITVAQGAVADVLAEVSFAMKLTSPAILRPLDAQADAGVVTVVTEMLDGARSLRGLLTTLATNGEKLPVSHATWIAIRLLEALEQAHGLLDAGHPAPVFHGRLSPEHVILTPSGDVRITGFGLSAAAKHLIKPPHKTDPTFAYFAPEQLTDAELTPGADTFCVGAILAECLIGKPLFIEDTFAQTSEAVRTRIPPLVRATRDDNVPKALDEAISYALEKSPDRRARRPDALRTRLEAFQGMLDVGDRIKSHEHAQRLADLIRLRKPPPAGLDVTSMEPVKNEKAAKRKGRPVLWALRLIFLLMVGGFGMGIYQNWRDLEEPLRARIPPIIATQLGIDQAPVLPVIVDAGSQDAGTPDAGPPDAGVELKPGLLSIASTPKGATVTLDGKELGVTPLTKVSVPAGEHTLLLVSKKPKLELSQTIKVAEGETKKLVLKLKRK